MKIKSYAKINLALDVLKREKKFHKISTVFQLVEFHDVLTFKIQKNRPFSLQISSDHPDVPLDGENTVVKAANALISAKPGIDIQNLPATFIHIQKNIPLCSGLGGGSSNAAVALLTLNRLWKLNLPNGELLRLAPKIGKDVPFFLYGGTALGTHYGEKIEPLNTLPKQLVLLIPATNKRSTKEQYERLDLRYCGNQTELTSQLVSSLSAKKKLSKNTALKLLKECVHNDFENNSNRFPILKKLLTMNGADVAFISGSGPTTATLHASNASRNKLFQYFVKQNIYTIKTHTI